MIIDKPEIVYVIENQSVTITITLSHVNAAVIWKRYLCCQVSYQCLWSFIFRKGITSEIKMYLARMHFTCIFL